MNERKILRRLRGGDSEALAEVIEAYSPYVYAIVKNIIQPPLQPEDIEEVVSDVFLRLWERAGDPEEGKLKAWLAAVTRNRAKDKLRALRLTVPLEEDALELVADGPETESARREAARLTRQAVYAMPEPDRSIFQRHYFLYQKTDEIAAELNMNPATVRTRLARGRDRLRDYLTERGVCCEAEYC